jgi:AhpD family alkylhydroperoxidase
MGLRVNYAKQSPEGLKAMQALEHYLNNCELDRGLLDLVRTRVSQLNGCAMCLDLHVREAQMHGITAEKLFLLDAWRETPWYSARERAALQWAEVVTNIQVGHAPDAAFDQARAEFNEKELVDLTMAINSMNSWNRLGVAFRAAPLGKDGTAAAAIPQGAKPGDVVES